jgi:membrane-associated phospholipid phosphatase
VLAVGLLAFHWPAAMSADTRAYRESFPLAAHWPLLYERGYKLVALVDPLGYALIAASLAAVAFFRGGLRLAGAVAFVALGATLAAEAVKAVAHGPRGPFPIGETEFPSGHATAAAALAVCLVLVAPRLLRAPAAVLGATWTAVIGLMLLTTSVHRPSDVIAGVLTAGAFAGLAVAALSSAPRARRAPR